jgi:hypothetical protein
MGMMAVTLGLAAGAFAAWWYSTPANGLLLIAGILGLLTIIAGLSISKLEDQDRQAETYRSIFHEMRERLPVSIRFGTTESGAADIDTLQWTTHDAPVSVRIPEPEVHRVVAAMLGEAMRMAAEGRDIDDICRVIDPQFDARDSAYQSAFRKLAQAMIDQG